MDTASPISRDLIESSIAVIGMSLRFPGADTVEEYWRNLKEGVESVSFFSDAELTAAGVDPAVFQQPNYVRARGILSDIHGFDAFFFGFNPKEAETMDVQHRIFLECAWEAMESAGYDPEKYPGLIGVYAGANMSTYFLRHIYPNLGAMGSAAGYQTVISNDKDFMPSLASYKLNLRGPSVCIQSACSTALVAAHSACQSLLNGECDLALAGGVSVETPQETGYLYEEEMILSPDGHCRPFDVEARGTVGGNGCGIVLLKRLEDALEDRDPIRAIIRGSAVNNDGALKVGYTAPGIAGQASVITEALAVARVDPESIGYVEAHGTGTALGDPVEIEALRQAFGTEKRGFCAIGSVKSNFGHIGPAAGAAGLIKAALAVESGVIPATLHYKNPNPKSDFANSPFFVNSESTEWRSENGPRRAGVSSFGIGGTNAHLVLEETPEIPQTEFTASTRPWRLLVLSAKTESALDRAARNLASHFRANPNIDLDNAAFTLQAGRRRFSHRRALVGRDVDDAIQALESSASDRPHAENVSSAGKETSAERETFNGSRVIFMFSGQGSQYVHMGRDIYETEPVFRESVDQCGEILKPVLGTDLRDIIYPDPEAEAESEKELNRTALTQPALFVIEYALARLWMSWGIYPEAMIGHSIGVYVAACLAEVFSLKDALALVVERGRLMGSVPTGAMTAVFLSESETIEILKEDEYSDLSLAAVNSPSLSTLSGPTSKIQELETRLDQAGAAYRRLRTSHAFHSGMMDPILDTFTEKVAGISLQPPTIPFVSNLTGTWIEDAEAVSSEYWANHLRRTVRFADGIETLLAEPDRIFLEIGPGPTLSTFADQVAGENRKNKALSSLPHPGEKGSDSRFLLTTLGKLWVSGAEIDWEKFHAGRLPNRIPLPTYPFEHQSYCVEASAGAFGRVSSQKARPAGKKPKIEDWFYLPSWKRIHSPDRDATDADGDAHPWIILMDECGLGRNIADRLQADGRPCITVTEGPAFSRTGETSFTVNPAMPGNFRSLWEALGEASEEALEFEEGIPYRALHLWSLTSETDAAESSAESDVWETLSRGFHSLLYLAQAMGKAGGNGEIFIVANGLQEVTGTEPIHPIKSALLGLAAVIPQEQPTLRCRSIDIEAPWAGNTEAKDVPAPIVDQLMRDLLSNDSRTETAYRGNFRWVRCFEPLPLKALPASPSRLRDRGVYWITGGLGEIGLILARHLAKNARARIVLSGRSDFPGREDWDDRIAELDPENSVRRRILAIREIESLGGEVLICRADVADETAMRETLARTLDQFGRLDGVIHAAGRTGADAMRSVEETDAAVCETHFGPKIKGLRVLERVLGDRPLDFCILMSSLSSVLGGLGFGAYAAANRFMDAFARKKSRETEVPWYSVDWDGWQTKAAGEAETTLGASVAELAIEPEEGMQVFDRVLSLADASQVLISTGDLDSRLDKWLQPQISGTRTAEHAKTRHPRPELATPFETPRSEPERILADIFEELLGIEAVGIHDNFFELGGHSLLATQVASRIQETFRIRLPLQRMFESPTVSGLSEALAQNRMEHADEEEMAGLLDNLEGMSEEEALKLLQSMEDKEDG